MVGGMEILLDDWDVFDAFFIYKNQTYFEYCDMLLNEKRSDRVF